MPSRTVEIEKDILKKMKDDFFNEVVEQFKAVFEMQKPERSIIDFSPQERNDIMDKINLGRMNAQAYIDMDRLIGVAKQHASKSLEVIDHIEKALQHQREVDCQMLQRLRDSLEVELPPYSIGGESERNAIEEMREEEDEDIP